MQSTLKNNLHVGIVSRSDNTAALDLACALDEIGVKVTLYLCAMHVSLEAGTNDHPDERLFQAGILPRSCRLRLVHYPRMHDLRSFSVVRKLSQTISADGVDLVHLIVGPGEIWLAVLANLLHNIPIVSTLVIPFPNMGDALPKSFSMTSYRWLAHGSDVIIVNGKDQVNQVKQIYHIPEENLFYIPLSARMTSVKWSEGKFTEQTGSILFFGRADPHKGLEYLIRAQPAVTEQVPNARFVIVAHGEYLQQVLPLIADPEKFEIHAEFVSNDLASMFFQQASLVAVPYLTASTSGVLLTAYGFGKPVVATQVGSLPEYVQNGKTGLLIPPADVEQLAAALITLLKDDELRHNMGKDAKTWVYQRQKEIAHQTQQVYLKARSLHQ